jgi:O-antigen/teichoic acid export membrane protein
MNYFRLQVKYGIVVFSILASFIYLFSTEIINFIYGKEYVEYAYLLTGFVVIYMFIYITMLQRYILRTVELTKVIFTSYVASTTFAFASSYLLIEYFQIDGVLIGMLAIQLLISIIFYKYIVSTGVKYV